MYLVNLNSVMWIFVNNWLHFVYSIYFWMFIYYFNVYYKKFFLSYMGHNTLHTHTRNCCTYMLCNALHNKILFLTELAALLNNLIIKHVKQHSFMCDMFDVLKEEYSFLMFCFSTKITFLFMTVQCK